jgi:hypothetical protein
MGPFMVLLLGVAFTGIMLYQLIGHLRFVFASVSTEATIERKWEGAKSDGGYFALTYTDNEGREHAFEARRPERTWENQAPGDSLSVRYLQSDPQQVRFEEDVHPAWRWALVWVVLGVMFTGFAVVLTWGRRARRPKGWRSSPDRPW